LAVEEESFFGLTVIDWQATKKNDANKSVLMNRIAEVVMFFKMFLTNTLMIILAFK
jgi:hypothetical protein